MSQEKMLQTGRNSKCTEEVRVIEPSPPITSKLEMIAIDAEEEANVVAVTSWRDQLEENSMVDLLGTDNQWYIAVVLKVVVRKGSNLLLRYERGYEIIDRQDPRIQPLNQWRKNLAVDDAVDCLLQKDWLLKKWYTAVVKEVDEESTRIKIHYNGWYSRFDEWIEREDSRIQQFKSHATGGRAHHIVCAFGAFVGLLILTILLPIGLVQSPIDDAHNEQRRSTLSNQKTTCYFAEIDITEERNCDNGGVQIKYIGYAPDKCEIGERLSWWSEDCSFEPKALNEEFKCYVEECSSGEIHMKPVNIEDPMRGGTKCVQLAIGFGILGCFCLCCCGFDYSKSEWCDRSVRELRQVGPGEANYKGLHTQ